MIAIYLFYGLAFFILGVALFLESRRSSALPLAVQLRWLAAFGFLHGLVEWLDLLILTAPGEPQLTWLMVSRTILMPLSTILLIRFGAGLIAEAGPLPKLLFFLPIMLMIPLSILLAVALIDTTLDPFHAVDVWARYLLYFPGCLLAAYGLRRHSRALPTAGLSEAQGLLMAAATTFVFNSIVAGLVVPAAPYGLAPWLNYDSVMAATGLPVQLWRMISAILVTIFMIRALDVFEEERKQNLARAESKRAEAEAVLRESEEHFRTVFEFAPIGIDLVDQDGIPFQANKAMQDMLGYSAEELERMVFTDYTHPDDVEISSQMVQKLAAGVHSDFHIQKRYVRKDGEIVWGNVYVSAVREATGQLRHFIAMVEDITREKQMREQLLAEREKTRLFEVEAQRQAKETAENWSGCLVEISRRIANMDNVDHVLLYIVEQANKLLNSDTASLGLLNEERSVLEIKYRAVGASAHIHEPPLLVDNSVLLSHVTSCREFRYPENTDGQQPGWHCPLVAKKLKAAVVVPLHFDKQPIGALWVGRFREARFDVAELTGLESLADQAVIALQHALMASQLQSIAVMEERSRIAREMHDGLAQILGYLSLQTQTLELLAHQDNKEQLLDELKRARENIKVAQEDVRENILSLRTTLAGETGLVSALEEYVSEFGAQTGNRAIVVNELEGPPNLSPLAQVQLVRIVQEALANVRKHAGAKFVRVILTGNSNCLHVAVVDDGTGFQVAKTKGHFGLQTMRERVEGLGGRIEIVSEPGAGTRVAVELPLLVE